MGRRERTATRGISAPAGDLFCKKGLLFSVAGLCRGCAGEFVSQKLVFSGRYRLPFGHPGFVFAVSCLPIWFFDRVHLFLWFRFYRIFVVGAGRIFGHSDVGKWGGEGRGKDAIEGRNGESLVRLARKVGGSLDGRTPHFFLASSLHIRVSWCSQSIPESQASPRWLRPGHQISRRQSGKIDVSRSHPANRSLSSSVGCMSLRLELDDDIQVALVRMMAVGSG